MKNILLNLCLCGLTFAIAACSNVPVLEQDKSLRSAQEQFFDNLKALCGEKFAGRMTFPTDAMDSFAGKKLVADVESCSDQEIRIPFAVGDDHSRTWIVSKTEHGLQLKHDHRHKDGSEYEVNMYGGIAGSAGTPLLQSFAADTHTANVIPEAKTNVWNLSLDLDNKQLRYHLERHAAPRFTAVLHQVRNAQAIPPRVRELTIPSNGKRMPGIAYLAEGEGPHPTVLLLHGYPGNEKNLDIAQGLRRAGWNVVFFHYRGAWGAEGEFSFLNAQADVAAALNYLRQPEITDKLAIDPDRISLVGHSMGGHMAIAGIFDDAETRCSIAYDPANLGARGKGFFEDAEASKMWLAYSDTLYMLKGWSGNKAKAESIKHGEKLDLVKRASALNGRPLLIVAADTDVIPMELHIDPLVEEVSKHDKPSLTLKYLIDDHSFSASRLELLELSKQFLNQNCR